MTEAREIPPTGILQPWVAALGLRHQGVLLTAVRGCDTEERHGVSKALTRAYRAEILNTHCKNPEDAKSFIQLCEPVELWKRMADFARSHDHLPHHFTMHLVHAAEIVGYEHPDHIRRNTWCDFYCLMCEKFHMHPESPLVMHNRLSAKEEDFAKAQ